MPANIPAASRAAGQGTISVALVATPSTIALDVATLAAWLTPRSSQLMISSRSQARYPKRSARLFRSVMAQFVVGLLKLLR